MRWMPDVTKTMRQTARMVQHYTLLPANQDGTQRDRPEPASEITVIRNQPRRHVLTSSDDV